MLESAGRVATGRDSVARPSMGFPGFQRGKIHRKSPLHNGLHNICPCILGAFFLELGWSPLARITSSVCCCIGPFWGHLTRIDLLFLNLQNALHLEVQGLQLSDPTKIPPLSRDRCSNTPVALCFLWYCRLSLLHLHFFL